MIGLAAVRRARQRRTVLAAVLGVVLTGLVATVFAAAPPSTREDALAALAHPTDAEARRDAVQWFGERGTMSDVPALVKALRDRDLMVRGLAESALWQVWSRSGDEETDRELIAGIDLMNARQLALAIEAFTRVIDRRPDFAEGWNKRATAYFLLGEHRKSLADCDEVIKRNPYHFGALSGYGMIYLQLDEPARALEYFERALAVNPNLRQVYEAIEALRQLLRERRRNMI